MSRDSCAFKVRYDLCYQFMQVQHGPYDMALPRAFIL